MNMIERINQIITLIEIFNKDYDQYRLDHNPNEPYASITAHIKGYNGNGYPNHTPEDDQIDETISLHNKFT